MLVTGTGYSSTVSVSCEAGFILNGPSLITCQSDNKWSKYPTCLPEECSQNLFGVNCSKSCSCDQSNTHVCHRITGQCVCKSGWTGNACSDDINECQTGLVCKGDNERCINNPGRYSCGCLLHYAKVDSGICVPDCGNISLSNGNVIVKTNETLLGSIAELTCYKGYIMSGNNTIQCKDDGTWGILPTCKEIDCGIPFIYKSEMNVTNTGYSSTVSVSCEAGFILNGPSLITCQSDNKWSKYPTCLPEDTGVEDQRIKEDKVDVYLSKEWSSVCSLDWNFHSAHVLCRILGFAAATLADKGDVIPVSGKLVTSIACSRALNETSLSQCDIKNRWDYDLEDKCKNYAVVTCTSECRHGFYGQSCKKCNCDSEHSYTCESNSGKCVCKDGWTGVNCTEDINECLTISGACSSHLKCINTEGSFICRCGPGYFEIRDGLCQACPRDYFGINCLEKCNCTRQKTDFCDHRTGKCFCKNGWMGPTCAKDINECLNTTICSKDHEVCLNEDGGYTCSCEFDYLRDNNGHCVSVSDVGTQSSLSFVAVPSAVSGVVVVVVIVLAIVCVSRFKQMSTRRKSGILQEALSRNRNANDLNVPSAVTTDNSRINSTYEQIFVSQRGCLNAVSDETETTCTDAEVKETSFDE